MHRKIEPFSCSLLCCAFVALFSCVIAQQPQEAKPTASAIPIQDTAALKANEGKEVTVSGVVSRVGKSKSGAIVFINFEGVKPGGFSAVVKSDSLPEIERAAGSNLDAALPGRRITLTGKISFYNEAPQIEIKTAGQLTVSR